MRQHRSLYNFDGRLGWLDPNTGDSVYEPTNPDAGWHDEIVELCGQSMNEDKVLDEFREKPQGRVFDIKTRKELYADVSPELAAHLRACGTCRVVYEAGMLDTSRQDIPSEVLNAPEEMAMAKEFAENPGAFLSKLFGY